MKIIRFGFIYLLDSFILGLVPVNVVSSEPTTVTVGRTGDQTTTITVTPTIGQSVELQCTRTSAVKQWYTAESKVEAIPNEISTAGGPNRILAFSSFTTSHAGTYSCEVQDKANSQVTTTYPVILATETVASMPPTTTPSSNSNSGTPSQSSNSTTIAIVVVLLIVAILVAIVVVVIGILVYLKRHGKLLNIPRTFSIRHSLRSSSEKEGFTRKDDQFEGHSSNSKDKAAALSVPPAKKGGMKERKSPPKIVPFTKKKEGDLAEAASSNLDQVTANGGSYCKPIATIHFLDHIRKLNENNTNGFEKEFETIVNDPDGVASVAKANKHKNRYNNIYTYNHSRVVLSVPDRNGSDYINASYIDGFKRGNAYIASQGPTPDTISDFWQMIWDSKTPIIVMLTQPEEKGKRKCEQYWNNNLSETFQAGSNMTVVVNQCLGFADYEVRDMTILNTTGGVSKSHNLHHFLYTGWPDHGVPQHPYSLVKLSQQVRKKYKKNSAPMVLHCSAGVGRTGTFITIDAMMQRLKERDDLNIYEFVTEMRSKRTFMVQTKEQYIFIHDALNDYVTCGATCVAAHDLRRLISKLNKVSEDSERTGFDEQFEVLQCICQTTSSDDNTYAKKETIAQKNRYSDRYPYSSKHLIISGKSRESGQGYINASPVQSYSNPRAFIAAQAPLENTREDFWELVWNFKPPTIVLLCDFVEGSQSTCSRFWPRVEHETCTESYSFVDVTQKSSKNQEGYVMLTLELMDTRKSDSKPFEVTLFHTREWKADNRPKLSSLLNIMTEVQRIQQGQTKPCLVACDDGMGRTGVFITVMSEIERIKFDGEIDIFQTIKAIRVQRPNMVSTGEQYKLCFEIIKEHLQSFDNYANFKPV